MLLALAGDTVWNVGTRGEPVRVAVRPGVDLFYLCTYGGLIVLRNGPHELELVSATEPAGDLAFAGGRIAAMAVESVHEEEVLRHQSQAALVVYVEPDSPRDDVIWARIRVDLNQASGGAPSHRVGAGVEAESPDWLTVGGEIDRARINEGYRWGDFDEPEDEEVVASLERRLKENDDPKALVRIIELPTIIEGIPHLLRAARALEPHLRHRDHDVAMAASRRMGSLVRWMRYYPVNTATHQAGSHREDCGPHENEIAAMEAALEAHHRRESRLV